MVSLVQKVQMTIDTTHHFSELILHWQNSNIPNIQHPNNPLFETFPAFVFLASKQQYNNRATKAAERTL
jgi:hypothetical protein